MQCSFNGVEFSLFGKWEVTEIKYVFNIGLAVKDTSYKKYDRCIIINDNDTFIDKCKYKQNLSIETESWNEKGKLFANCLTKKITFNYDNDNLYFLEGEFSYFLIFDSLHLKGITNKNSSISSEVEVKLKKIY